MSRFPSTRAVEVDWTGWNEMADSNRVVSIIGCWHTIKNFALIFWIASGIACEVHGQDLSWVKGAMERSKQVARENVPLWQYDPRVAAGSSDASLRGFACGSSDHVYAVGDRGLILASQDGGRTWNQQFSGTTQNLHAVTFFNDRHGIAVGGTIQPLSQSSVGVVLVTEDAGLRWRATSQASLPRLIGLLPGERGSLRAWGDYSSLHHSSVLESFDQGNSWQPVPSPLGHTQAVAQHSANLTLAIDRAGRISQLPSKDTRALQQVALPTVPILALAHTGLQWIAAGERGTLASSRDGKNWSDQQLPLSPQARSACNFRCVAVQGNNVWIGGSPGSLLLHSSDRGNSWRIQTTGQTWPVNAMQFFDEFRGWAVTDAGSILATRDGGRTWYSQRVAVKRIGLLDIAATPSQVSWPALAETAWKSRQSTELVVIHRENLEDGVDFSPDSPSTLATAGVQTGLVHCFQNSAFVLPDRRVRTARSIQQYYQQVTIVNDAVKHLRISRPTVVLVDELPDPRSSQLTEAVVQSITLAATEDPSFRWLEDELHLPPWQVAKLYASLRSRKADFVITQDQLLRDSGISVSDALSPALGLVGHNFIDSQLSCLQPGSGSSLARTALFHSSDRHPDSTRPVDLSNVGHFQLVMGRAHRENAWRSLQPGRSSSTSLEETEQTWLKNKLAFVVDASPRHEVGPALTSLANDYFRAGQMDRWYEILNRAIEFMPLSDASRWSELQALRYGASDERLAWEFSLRAEREQTSASDPVQLASAARLPGSQVIASNLTPFENVAPTQFRRDGTIALAGGRSGDTTSGEVVTASASAEDASLDVGQMRRQSRIDALRRAVAEYLKTAENDKALAFRPDVQLAHVSRRRTLSEINDEPPPDVGVLQTISSKDQLAGWQQMAAQELAIARGHTTLTTWAARARATKQPPKLDGIADDACWQQALPIEWTSPVATSSLLQPTTARFSYDDEFLYVLVECPLATGQIPITATRGLRKYDMPMEGSDHVLLQLDTDRDYNSACELAVNQAGHTMDRCCQISQWNPQWYVDVMHTEKMWIAEFAVKISDLTTAESLTGRAWAISAYRYIPGVDVQSWSQLRSFQPRHHGSGLLLFDP